MPAPRNALRSSWLWLLALFTVAGFVETTFWGQMNAFTPLYLPRLGVAPGDVARWTGISVAVASGLGIPFLPLWGALADRYTRQPIIVRSFLVHLLAGTLALVAGNIFVFVAARALMGFALGNSGLMMTTLSERVPPRRMGLAFAIMNTSPPVGAFVGPLVGGPVVDRWGFPALLAIEAALLLLVVLALTFGYRDTYRGTSTAPVLRLAAESLGIIWRSPRLRTLFPALFLMFAGWMLAFTYVPLAVERLYVGPTPGTAVGIVLGTSGLGALLLGPLLGALADRLGYWRVLMSAVAVAVLLWPLPALAHDLTSFTVAWGLVNGTISAAFALSFTVLSGSAASAVRGRVMSFAYLPVNVGSLVGPAIGSLLASVNIFSVFPFAAGVTALGLATLVLAARMRVEAVPQPAPLLASEESRGHL